jgi:hypothetical protein
VYSKHGVHLVERGWPGVIPLVPREKRPSIAGWERFNTSPVTLIQAEGWARQYPNHGIGHAAGHGLIGIDLDTDTKKLAAVAKRIAGENLGPTPMIRVGRPPRVMRYYRLEVDAVGRVSTKSFYLFGLYATTGQTAWFGIHPGTGRQYHWTEASPLDVGPSDLPVVTVADLKTFVDEMTTALPAPVNNGECRNTHPSSPRLSSGGATTTILREMGMSPHTPPIEVAVNWIKSASVGTRHHTMVGAVTALVHVGLADQEIFEAVADIHIASLSGDRPEERTRRVVVDAIAWARDRIGSNLDTLDSDLHVSDWSIWP